MTHSPDTSSADVDKFAQELDQISERHAEHSTDEYPNIPKDSLGCAECSTKILDVAKEQLRAAELRVAQDIKELCPITEGFTVERLHNRIDSYLAALQTEQTK